jgi:hypothetical protein
MIFYLTAVLAPGCDSDHMATQFDVPVLQHFSHPLSEVHGHFAGFCLEAQSWGFGTCGSVGTSSDSGSSCKAD